MRLPVGPKAPAQAREIVRDVVPSPELGPKAELLTSEIVSNAVKHSGMTPDDDLELNIDIEEGTVRVSVSDTGPRFEKPENPSPDYGYGLALVDLLSDRWGVVHDGANDVWFEIDLPPIPLSG